VSGEAKISAVDDLPARLGEFVKAALRIKRVGERTHFGLSLSGSKGGDYGNHKGKLHLHCPRLLAVSFAFKCARECFQFAQGFTAASSAQVRGCVRDARYRRRRPRDSQTSGDRPRERRANRRQGGYQLVPLPVGETRVVSAQRRIQARHPSRGSTVGGSGRSVNLRCKWSMEQQGTITDGSSLVKHNARSIRSSDLAQVRNLPRERPQVSMLASDP